jgi:predicted trehalose synthase
MLRSFSYAAATMAAGVERQLDMTTRELRSGRWERDGRAAYVAGYLAAPGRGQLLPNNDENLRALVALFETEKAFYELSYELNNRPEWVGIPMKGIARLLQRSGVTKSGTNKERD